ncbi:unnamed protein product [Parajaminaea phylloscopi]
MFHLLSSIYTDLTTRPRFNAVFLGEEGSGKTSLLLVLKERFVDGRPPPSGDAGETTGPESGDLSLPKTRPTVGQNVIDIAGPSLPPASGSAASSSSYKRLQRIWPPPPPPQAVAAATSATTSRGWFTRRSSSGPAQTLSSTSASHATASDHGKRESSTNSIIHIWDLGGEESLRPIWKEYYGETDSIVYFWDVERAGRGEARETAWECLLGIVKQKSLQGLPLLIVLSKADAAEGKPKAAEISSGDGEHMSGSEQVGHVLSGGLDSIESEDETLEGDLSLQTAPPLAAGLQQTSEVADDHATSSIPQEPRGTATALSDAQSPEDALRSLQAFISSHIEAFVVDRAQRYPQSLPRRSSAPASEGPSVAETGESADSTKEPRAEQGDGNADGGDADDVRAEDEEEFNTTVDGSPVLFPETSLVSLDLTTREGVDEVLRWLIDASVRA